MTRRDTLKDSRVPRFFFPSEVGVVLLAERYEGFVRIPSRSVLGHLEKSSLTGEKLIDLDNCGLESCFPSYIFSAEK